jgi:Zn-dependent M28 family amino/carboxypeptidase
MKRATRWTAVVAITTIAALTGPIAGAKPKDCENTDNKTTEKLLACVTAQGVRQHQAALQDIATDNDGTRASGTPGFDASADYVVETMTDAGYNVTRMPFEFPFFQELAPAELDRVSPDPETYATPADFIIMDYSGSGEPTANLQEVNDNMFPPGPNPSDSSAGCDTGPTPENPSAPDDFAGFVAGNIALIQRGTCPFAQKAANAEAAGASGVIIFNEGQPGRQDTLAGTLGGPGSTIPVVGVSFAFGQEQHSLILASDPDPVVFHMFTDTESETRMTENIFAESKHGKKNKPNTVVMAGAHLDSVLEGPGINDNGSGSAALLEIAENMQKVHPKNRVRFAWWGAEENGLLGSEEYVFGLSQEEIDEIALYLNFDMIGSPNFVRFVYDGDGSDTPDAGPAGSEDIEALFLDYFDSQGLATEPTAFDGRSDYGPFIEPGIDIPAGGLFSGAEGEKTPAQAAVYGGTAGESYDPCYHQACDTFLNNNNTVLGQFADAAAFAILTYAMDVSSVG